MGEGLDPLSNRKEDRMDLDEWLGRQEMAASEAEGLHDLSDFSNGYKEFLEKWLAQQTGSSEADGLAEFAVAGEFGAPDEAPQTFNNVHMDRYDNTVFNEILGASEKLRQVYNRHFGRDGDESTPEVWPWLVEDLWAVYYKPRPELVPENQVAPVGLVNRPFVERVLEDPDVQATRATTVLDELSAAVATIAAAERLADEYAKNEQLRNSMLEAARRLREAADSGTQEAIAAAYAEAKAAIDQQAQAVRQIIRQAVKVGAEKAQEMANILAGWGFGPGDLRQIPLEQRFNLIEKLKTPKFRQVASFIGRLRNLARAARRESIRRAGGEIHSITVGSDLAHLLPVELGMLRHPLRRLDFYRRFLEGQTLQYELRHRERVGRGPIVCCVDVSGSMSGIREDWAAAVALTLVDIATKERRHAAVIHFDNTVQQVVHFRPGERNPVKLASICTGSSGGGTDFEAPLLEALRIIGSSEYRKADIVFITDGECLVGEVFLDHFRRRKEELGIRVFGVLVGHTTGAGEVRKFADYVIPVHRVLDDGDEAASQIFAGVQAER